MAGKESAAGRLLEEPETIKLPSNKRSMHRGIIAGAVGTLVGLAEVLAVPGGGTPPRIPVRTSIVVALESNRTLPITAISSESNTPVESTTSTTTNTTTTSTTTTTTTAPVVQPVVTNSADTCTAALSYLASHQAPGFIDVCPSDFDYPHEATTCIPIADNLGFSYSCPQNGNYIFIHDPCPNAYINEGSNSFYWGQVQADYDAGNYAQEAIDWETAQLKADPNNPC
ncbi:MAG TPA: hypothetical protein VGF75_03115 [Candidatus Saccharimonadales bacterium]|jgi:hypothetical protein